VLTVAKASTLLLDNAREVSGDEFTTASRQGEKNTASRN